MGASGWASRFLNLSGQFWEISVKEPLELSAQQIHSSGNYPVLLALTLADLLTNGD